MNTTACKRMFSLGCGVSPIALCSSRMARTCRWFERLWRGAVLSLAANDALCRSRAPAAGADAAHLQYSARLWGLVRACPELGAMELGGCRA